MDTDKPVRAALNTDKEIWRGKSRAEFGDPDRFYADSLHIPQGDVEALGINCGGFVIVKPIREWHALAREAQPAATPRLFNADDVKNLLMKCYQEEPDRWLRLPPYELAEELNKLAAREAQQGPIELTPVNYDPVMARTHLLVPKDMKCHKCGAEEPWKDPRREEVAAALAEQERLNAAREQPESNECTGDQDCQHTCAAQPDLASLQALPKDMRDLADYAERSGPGVAPNAVRYWANKLEAALRGDKVEKGASHES